MGFNLVTETESSFFNELGVNKALFETGKNTPNPPPPRVKKEVRFSTLHGRKGLDHEWLTWNSLP